MPITASVLVITLKKEIYWRMFTDESISGTVPEIGNTAPAGGFTSTCTLEPAVTALTLNVISTSSRGSSEVTALLPLVVVNVLVVSLVP
jgi:hypothetical protein